MQKSKIKQNKVVIMAGGQGTRLASITKGKSKPMMPIGNMPILEREIRNLKEQGFVDYLISVNLNANGDLMHYFGNGRRFGVHIDYLIETEPLGNAGALFRYRKKLGDTDFLLINADSMFDVDFKRMMNFHIEKKASVTLFAHPNDHPQDSGLLICNEDKVVQWITKEEPKPMYYHNLVNAGLHIINPAVLDDCTKDGVHLLEQCNSPGFKADLDRDVLRPLAGTGCMYAYKSSEYVKDMGTPERYYRVNEDWNKGIPQSKNLKNKQKAIFLDRDGTINRFVPFLNDPKDMELLPGVAEKIRHWNQEGWIVVVVTNQPVIARGEVTVQQLDDIHAKMEMLLGEQGAYIDALYYCPHHPNKGFAGEIPSLKFDCDCRKPKPGLLLKAAEDLNIDLSQSVMIGDSENDILAGINAGCMTTILIAPDYGQTTTIENLADISPFSQSV